MSVGSRANKEKKQNKRIGITDDFFSDREHRGVIVCFVSHNLIMAFIFFLYFPSFLQTPPPPNPTSSYAESVSEGGTDGHTLSFK